MPRSLHSVMSIPTSASDKALSSPLYFAVSQDANRSILYEHYYIARCTHFQIPNLNKASTLQPSPVTKAKHGKTNPLRYIQHPSTTFNIANLH